MQVAWGPLDLQLVSEMKGVLCRTLSSSCEICINFGSSMSESHHVQELHEIHTFKRKNVAKNLATWLYNQLCYMLRWSVNFYYLLSLFEYLLLWLTAFYIWLLIFLSSVSSSFLWCSCYSECVFDNSDNNCPWHGAWCPPDQVVPPSPVVPHSQVRMWCLELKPELWILLLPQRTNLSSALLFALVPVNNFCWFFRYLSDDDLLICSWYRFLEGMQKKSNQRD